MVNKTKLLSLLRVFEMEGGEEYNLNINNSIMNIIDV